MRLYNIGWRHFTSLTRIEVTRVVATKPPPFLTAWVRKVDGVVRAEKDGVLVTLEVYVHV